MESKGARPVTRIGWAQAEITPAQPVLISGQFHARLSEGVSDPITATALALEASGDQAVMVGCDLVGVSDELRDAVRAQLLRKAEGLDPAKVVLHATHTHTAPEVRPSRPDRREAFGEAGVELPAMSAADYVAFAAERIAAAVRRAWESRAEGRIAFGFGQAVIGRNRRWVDIHGNSTMYGNTDTETFSHIEGYEDHSLNLLAAYDPAGALTGLVVNVPCTSQVSEQDYTLSADYWHEARIELRRRLGEKLFILPQCSAAGDQSPHLLFEKRGAQRMLELKARTVRQEIAHRIADSVEETLRYAGLPAGRAARRPCDEPLLRHRVEPLDLPMRPLTEEDVRAAAKEAETWRKRYEEEKRKLERDPSLRNAPRWYAPITGAYRHVSWLQGVADRFERQRTHPTQPAELHVIRLGDVAIATNPFEYYLDFGIYIKARSPAVQTFVVQLAGPGGYVPSQRSVAGGGYGSVPASTVIGPEGGRRFATRTIEVLQELWREPPVPAGSRRA